MVTKHVYDIQLKKQKKLHRRLGVFSALGEEIRVGLLDTL
jgi:hypothetical protein